MADDKIVCHVHDQDNVHVGTGIGSSAKEALANGVRSGAESRQGQMLRKGSFGCSEVEEEAHELALKANSSVAEGLPNP